MSENRQTITDLLNKVIADQCTDQEAANFFQLVRELPKDDILRLELEDRWNNLIINENLEEPLGSSMRDRILARIHDNTQAEPAVTPTGYPSPFHRVQFLKTAWFRYAAAVLILITAIAFYYNFSRTVEPDKNTISSTGILTKADIPPGYNRAILTLSNGQKVELDSAASATIQDGSLNIKNVDGQLNYYGLSERQALNTMATPKGGQYKLTLSDGTRVWLNAASSITYPISFTTGTRQVSITGEAYFEVKHDKQKPFIVKTATDQITVLGTSFNVNAYNDEQTTRTSLLEGSVKINDVMLRPGEAYSNGNVTKTNIQQDVAWKNGVFDFNGADLPAVMRKLERWYDIDVQYAGPVKQRRFRGELPRSFKLSEVLEILNDVNVKYHIKGRTVIIE